MKQLIVAGFVCLFALSATGVARADDATTQAKIESLQAQLDAVKAQLDALKAAQLAPPPVASPKPRPAGNPVTVDPDTVTFMIGGERVRVYGNLDLSFDDTTKGLAKTYALGGSPVGNVGYLAGVSTNLSYIGISGTHKLGPLSGLVYQLETQIDVS